MQRILAAILLLLSTCTLHAAPLEVPTETQLATVLQGMVVSWYARAGLGAQEQREWGTYYSTESTESLARSILHYTGEEPFREKQGAWIAHLVAAFWSQSRLRADALSLYNYERVDGVPTRVMCSWSRFSPLCDYGRFQFNGSTARMLWKMTFGQEFRPRVIVELKQDDRTIPMALVFLRRQESEGMLSCDKVLRRAGALRKGRCSRYLRYADHLLKVPTERDVKRSSFRCGRRDCDRVCACEILRRASGGEPGRLDTGVAVYNGGTVNAWWIAQYTQELSWVLAWTADGGRDGSDGEADADASLR